VSKQLPTIAMGESLKHGYVDPVGAIERGNKKHTLRKCRHHGDKEITAKGKGRTGIVLRFHKHVEMTRDEFLTDVFALADGIAATDGASPAQNLQALLEHFYGKVPETMWCNHFHVVERPEEAPE